jgi:transglutaminase superfamily protein
VKRVSLTALAVVSALALYLTSGSSLAIWVTVVLGVAGFVGERLEIPPRPLLVITLVCVVGPFVWQPELPRASGFLFEPGLSFAGGLFSCLGTAVLLLRRNRGWEELLILGTSTVTMLTAGNTTAAFPFAYAVAIYTICLVAFLRFRRLGFRASTFATSSLALVFALGLAVVLGWSEAGFNNFFSSMQSWSASINFGDIAGIKPQSGPGGTKVLLRVFSGNPENYMAARRYVKYESQKWRGAEARKVFPKNFEGQPGYLLRGPLEKDWNPERTDRIEVATLSPDALLAPLNSRVIKVNLDDAELSWCGDLVVKDTGAGFAGSYEVAMGAIPLEEDPEYLQRCLEVEVSTEVAALAQEIAGAGSDKFKVFNLVKFFQENFEYGFGFPFDRADDPVAKFLEERPPAHCEVFATSLALMCRSVGVPARYVQGFLVRERNEWGGYWVSRERDAHAWVEVYIEGAGWVQVDSTPPGVSGEVESASSWGEFSDWVKRMFQRAWAFVARGPTAMLKDLSDLLSRYPLGFGFLLFIAVGWRLRHRLRFQRTGVAGEESEPVHPSVVKMQSFLNAYEQAVGEERPSGFTLLEWAQQQPEDRIFLETYSEVRYSRDVPSDEALERLEELLNAVERRHAKKG